MQKRIVLDDRGNAVVEVKNKDGYFEPAVDAEAIARLKANELSMAGTLNKKPSGPVVGQNPYQGATVAGSKQLRTRSGLDYLRSLSAEIERRRRDEGDKT